MVEGHQCHRVAYAHRRLMLGRSFEATSPNGRFTEGAAAIHQKPLTRIEVHGKYLFYFFASSPEAPPTVLHFHFGMSGAFRTMALPGKAPTATTRLQLINRELGMVGHLSAMTCLHGGTELYDAKIAKLGPDPLREDADKERVWAKIRGAKFRKSIGLVLMDQALVAGLGNIYRAEVLFKCGLHPEQPAASLSRPEFELVWHHSTVLLQRGFASGSILTVDQAEAKVLGNPWTRRYVYNQSMCGRCKGTVTTWDMAGRTVHACSICQPLRGGEVAAAAASGEAAAAAGSSDAAGAAQLLTAARAAVLRGATPAKVFRSHCVAEDPSDPINPAKMTVAELRVALLARGLAAGGPKATLSARLSAACEAAAAEAAPVAGPRSAAAAAEAEAAAAAEVKTEPTVQDGVGGSGVAAAAEAPATVMRPIDPARRLAEATPASLKRAAAAQAGGDGGEEEAEEGEEGGGGSGDEMDRLEEMLSLRMRVPAALDFGVGPSGGDAGPSAAADPTTAALASAEASLPMADSAGPSGAGGSAAPTDQAAAPPAVASTSWLSSTVAQVKDELRARGLPTSGRKAELMGRLTAATAAATTPQPTSSGAAPAAAASSGGDGGGGGGGNSGAAVRPQVAAAAGAAAEAGIARDAAAAAAVPVTVVGIQHIAFVASAREAAMEKMIAGESRGVEHVAMAGDDIAMAGGVGPSASARPALQGAALATASRRRRHV